MQVSITLQWSKLHIHVHISVHKSMSYLDSVSSAPFPRVLFEDLHELDPRSFLIVEVKRDRPGVLGEILELRGRWYGCHSAGPLPE